MAGCQNYGPFLGTLNIRGRIIIGTPKGTIILTTTHIEVFWRWKRTWKHNVRTRLIDGVAGIVTQGAQ